jgi:Na+/melibiose symporter-like transporter
MMLIIGGLGLALAGFIGYVFIVAIYYILVSMAVVFAITAFIFYYIIYQLTDNTLLSSVLSIACTIAVFAIYSAQNKDSR